MYPVEGFNAASWSMLFLTPALAWFEQLEQVEAPFPQTIRASVHAPSTYTYYSAAAVRSLHVRAGGNIWEKICGIK